MRKPRDPTKKKKKKLDDQCEDEALELEGPLITPGSGESSHVFIGCVKWWMGTGRESAEGRKEESKNVYWSPCEKEMCTGHT